MIKLMSNRRTAESAPPRPAFDVLCSNLSHGIHAAAQPLTILLASLSKAHTDRMNIEELHELTASSYEEVQRVCTLFGYLQELVIAESIKPHLSATSLLPLLASAAEGVRLLYRRDGMVLSSTVPEACPPVLINGPRTLRAFLSVLLTAHALSRARDQVELIASSSVHGMQIVIKNSNLSVAAVSAEARLSMAAAEANIRSQQAGFLWSEQPFHVLIDLPRAPLVH
jgi:signal transduction histidine kinase